MAEIRVQEKRGGLTWLWMLLLLLLVALAVWYFLGDRAGTDGTVEPAPAATPAASPTADPSLPGHPPVSRMVFVRA